MDQHRLVMDPQLMMAKLCNAIMNSSDADAKDALRQVRLVVGLRIDTTAGLLEAMAEPMRTREKERKADSARERTSQDSVNVAGWHSTDVAVDVARATADAARALVDAVARALVGAVARSLPASHLQKAHASGGTLASTSTGV